MPQFEFYVDKKVTSWYRETHYINADTLEEAQKMMIKNFNEGNTDETFDSQDEIPDTWDVMTTKDNGDNPTMELWCEETMRVLTDNQVNQPTV